MGEETSDSYVRRGLLPITSIQGDADPTVPCSHSVRLQEALKQVGVDGELITIPGGKHGGFTRAENERAYKAKSLLGQTRSRPNNLFKLSSVDKLQRSAQPANGGMGSPGVANMISVIALILRFP